MVLIIRNSKNDALDWVRFGHIDAYIHVSDQIKNLCAYCNILYMQNNVSTTACAPNSQHNIQSVPASSHISLKSYTWTHKLHAWELPVYVFVIIKPTQLIDADLLYVSHSDLP